MQAESKTSLWLSTTCWIANKDLDVEYAIQLNESIKAVSSIFSQIDSTNKESVDEQLKKAKIELIKLQRKVLYSNLNIYALGKPFQDENENTENLLGLSKFLYLHQEVIRKRDEKYAGGEKALSRLKDAFYSEGDVAQLQTLKDIEELIYFMINKPPESPSTSIDMSRDFNMSYQSLSDKIREMIRHDRGYSIVNSSDSGGIPSPIRESESFK